MEKNINPDNCIFNDCESVNDYNIEPDNKSIDVSNDDNVNNNDIAHKKNKKEISQTQKELMMERAKLRREKLKQICDAIYPYIEEQEIEIMINKLRKQIKKDLINNPGKVLKRFVMEEQLTQQSNKPIVSSQQSLQKQKVSMNNLDVQLMKKFGIN
jgi:hypothetical protein